MSSVGGGMLVFDPEAAQAAANAVRSVYQDALQVQARCSSQHARANEMWSSFVRLVEGLTALAVETLWYEMGLGGLNGELHETARWLDDLRARLEAVRTSLVETHPGAMERELYDRLTPHIAAFQSHRDQVITAANNVFFAGAPGPVGLCIELLGDVCYALGAEAALGEELGGWLNWVAARETDLINLAAGPLENLWQVAAAHYKDFDLLQKEKSILDLLLAVRKEKGLLKGLEELTSVTPGGAALDALWTFLATGDFTAHGAGAAIFGEAFQVGVYAIPVAGPIVAVTQVALAGTALAGSGLSWTFDALGAAQGGALGAADHGVGNSWEQTATDASNGGSAFTNLGAITYDGLASGIAWMEGAPSPVSSQQFNTDLSNLGGSAWGLVNVPKDIISSTEATGIDLGVQSIEGGMSFFGAPAGVQSSVDSFLNNHVANVLANW